MRRFVNNIAIVAREEGTTRDNVVTTIDDSFILIGPRQGTKLSST